MTIPTRFLGTVEECRIRKETVFHVLPGVVVVGMFTRCRAPCFDFLSLTISAD